MQQVFTIGHFYSFGPRVEFNLSLAFGQLCRVMPLKKLVDIRKSSRAKINFSEKFCVSWYLTRIT